MNLKNNVIFTYKKYTSTGVFFVPGNFLSQRVVMAA